MAWLESIKGGVKLRRTDEHMPTKIASNAVEQEKYLNQRLRDCDLESWYPALKNYTFPAEFVPVSVAEAKAIINRYWHLKRGRIISDKDNGILHRLSQKLHDQIVNCFSDGVSFPSVFIKMSCRSPKDSAGRQTTARKIAMERIRHLESNGHLITGNDLADAIYHGSIQCLKLESAEEVINTLCTSERVCEDDLPLALNFQNSWSQNIVVRPWTDIATSQEFRGFVSNGRLCGLCQYYSSVYYPHVVKQKAQIVALVQELFEQTKDKVPIQPADYVIDLAVDVKTQMAHIIEFNPFGKPDGMGTGTLMFDLSKQKDQDVLFGSTPFECRVVEAPVPNVESRIKGDWRALFEQYL
jgi:hypothetical protein